MSKKILCVCVFLFVAVHYAYDLIVCAFDDMNMKANERVSIVICVLWSRVSFSACSMFIKIKISCPTVGVAFTVWCCWWWAQCSGSCKLLHCISASANAHSQWLAHTIDKYVYICIYVAHSIYNTHFLYIRAFSISIIAKIYENIRIIVDRIGNLPPIYFMIFFYVRARVCVWSCFICSLRTKTQFSTSRVCTIRMDSMEAKPKFILSLLSFFFT